MVMELVSVGWVGGGGSDAGRNPCVGRIVGALVHADWWYLSSAHPQLEAGGKSFVFGILLVRQFSQ